MKKNLFLTFFLASSVCLAQNNKTNYSSLEKLQQKHSEDNLINRKNLIKLNGLALSTGTVSIQYERLITEKFTIAANVNYMPKEKLPFLSSIESLIDDAETNKQIKNAKLGSFSFTPEAKYYFGKEEFKGFYIAPFIRFASYNLDLPISYDYEGNKESINIDGKVNTFSAGLAFGAQWKLSKDFYLDWLILGPHYGSSNGDLSGNRTLNQEEQDAVNKSLKDLDIPMVDYSYEVNSQGAKAKLSGPWAGIRTSLSIGYRF